ncbi:MAG: translation initiation factor IF-2 [Ignavibacteriales bacterium]|nr:translation initiation factor IF-2 [Ignavibacteriales bacterium]
MADTGEKKIKIFNLAKELNLSSDTIIEFLTKKGYKIKGLMSLVEPDMMKDIMSHFKKDRDVAERHQKKIAELKETKRKTAEPKKVEEVKAEPAKPKAGEQAPPPELVIPAAKPESVVHPEPPFVEEAAAIPEPSTVALEPEVLPVAALAIVQQPEPQPEPLHTEDVKPPAAAAPPPPEEQKPPVRPKMEGGRYVSPLDRQVQARTSRGLTIKGRMDLTPVKTAKPQDAATLRAEEEIKKKKKKKKKIKDEKPKSAAPTEGEGEESSKKKKKKRKLRPVAVDDVQVNEAIKRTLAGMDESTVSLRAANRKKKKREREEERVRQLEAAAGEEGKLHLTEFLTVGELANLMGVSVAEVIAKCIGLGLMVSINQRLEKDNIMLVADEFGFQVDFQHEVGEDILEDEPDAPETLKSRAPVVTIMGHVDHGKTSLLDYIRRTRVVAGESGGITQHIGAYEVTLDNGKKVTFLDTPGHEAFTAMRARGAQLTDIVVLVVAAEDNVMPQTLEAISHARAANVPIIIAINKIDKPEANPDRIRQQLGDKGVLVEEWGGKVQCVEVSARSGKNVDLLLEKILLEAEVLDLKANPDRLARCAVVEAQIDKGKGILATVLVQKGTLKVGDPFIGGIYSGRVKAMFDERGNRQEVAGPSTPVQLLGFDGIPQAGDQVVVVESERVAREIGLKRQQLKREQDFRQIKFVTLDEISQQIQAGQQVRELSMVVKGDVDGSVEALSDSLMKLSTAEVKVHVIHKGVGGISENDVLLSAASNAIIIGFHVRPNLNARRLAEKEKVDIRLYNIIYDAINEVRTALEGMLAPTVSEEVTATVEVRDTFKIPKVGTIAGCYVTDGKIVRNNRIRLLRDGISIFEGGIASLKRFKDDVREVEQSFECGISLENFNDLKPGDIIEAFKLVETKRKL